MERANRITVHNEYIYMRTKDYIFEGETQKLYLYAGLVIKQYSTTDTEINKKVIPVHSDLIEGEVSAMPTYAEEIPSGTFSFDLTKKQFHKLLTKAHEDPATLFIFKL
ncbi:hypothetical protein [Bacillus sp. UMB0728]|uniref:hypothetical protein n=1 Tax=Bacillus sp. UMB0728 TaxID=2066052 RepID=UPI000C75C11F|nr:hypothetical protein [Bacillus sp. UMB0728]PLR72234.1 hypothetical protein CYJ37_11810 [Bacillus sp. UMB0728]